MSKSPKPICLFHKNCVDGGAAAAVVQRKVGDCDFLPMQHSETPPMVEGREVWIVDFGMPLAAMRAMHAQATRVHWYDHHASQSDVHRALGWGVLDTTECGASLVWRELFPGITPPPIIPYIKDKDLWQWRLPGSRAVALALEARHRWKWAGILDADPLAMMAEGEPMLAELRLRVAAAAKAGVEWRDALGVPGLRAWIVHTRRDQNDLGEYISLPVDQGGLGYDVAILAYRKRETGKWVHSMRSSSIDCGQIAARLGGGGHPGSACFISDTPAISVMPAEV